MYAPQAGRAAKVKRITFAGESGLWASLLEAEFQPESDALRPEVALTQQGRRPSRPQHRTPPTLKGRAAGFTTVSI